MNLFKLGDFKMHSGGIGKWKIECDALSDEDIECIAFMLQEKLPDFGGVVGVPRGGLRLAEAMCKYVHPDGPMLIVDDVLTTGRSMEEMRNSIPHSIGAVIFARTIPANWITPLFQM